MSETRTNRSARALRRDAWSRFEAGDFEGAAAAFMRLAESSALAEPELQALIELLLDRGDPETAIAMLDREIGRQTSRDVGAAPFRSLAQHFDLLLRYGAASRQRGEAGLRLLEALAGADDPEAWSTWLPPERRDEIEQEFPSPMELLAALEQEALAPPETGLPARARAMIEAIGQVGAEDPEVSRAAERLLHALGAPAAAYRVERARKAATRRWIIPESGGNVETGPDFSGLIVVLAGGHAALRAIIERDLTRSGVTAVRAIPSAKEASRVGRDVQAVLAGSDVVVLLVRQLAHSTSDQVRRAAARSGVPAVMADSAGIAGVRRALERFVSETRMR